jgi:hypothetical protein
VLRSEFYGTKADVFSFGIILWEMHAQKIPYEDMNQMQVMSSLSPDPKHKIPYEDVNQMQVMSSLSLSLSLSLYLSIYLSLSLSLSFSFSLSLSLSLSLSFPIPTHIECRHLAHFSASHLHAKSTRTFISRFQVDTQNIEYAERLS